MAHTPTDRSAGLEYWLRHFGMPEENIEKCATQIAQGYGACRYLEGVQIGAKAVNELAEQEHPSFPSNLDEAAEAFAHNYDMGTCDGYAQECFKAGAEWMAGQGCNIDSYQKQARTFLLEKFQNMPMFELVKYCALGLNEEAGEVAGKIKKSIRDADGEIYEGRIDAIVKEMGDVLWYLAIMAYALGLPLSHIAQKNIEKLSDRMNRGKIQGEGDER